jgi:hypothetical protein
MGRRQEQAAGAGAGGSEKKEDNGFSIPHFPILISIPFPIISDF